MDQVTRRRIMASITKRDTKPEMIVRRALHAAGMRFRLHDRRLPGTPDIVLPGRRTVVLVNGCFWHQHPGCRMARRPSRNTSYWHPKLARNVDRDAAQQQLLAAAGWRVLVIWECEAQDMERLASVVEELKSLPSLGRRRAGARRSAL